MGRPAFRVVGLMAGSSHDGLDIALVRFRALEPRWCYEILFAETVRYPPSLEAALHQSLYLSGADLIELSSTYTDWTAETILEKLRGKVYDLVSWHGPTVFHQPEWGVTWSLGDSERLRARVGKPVVAHFRARDLASGGQGAPLIPHADIVLWPEYETLLNLGGIANITHLPTRSALDISPCNQLLNALAHQLTPPHSFDPDGAFAREGHLLPELQEIFLTAPVFKEADAVAITNEIVRTQFIEPFLAHSAPVKDKLHTAVHAIAAKISQTLSRLGCQKVYLTGGGAHNTYLVEALRELAPCPCLLPPDSLIDFREAIGFAFLGLKRYLGEDNLHAVWTCARQSQSAGLLSL